MDALDEGEENYKEIKLIQERLKRHKKFFFDFGFEKLKKAF